MNTHAAAQKHPHNQIKVGHFCLAWKFLFSGISHLCMFAVSLSCQVLSGVTEELRKTLIGLMGEASLETEGVSVSAGVWRECIP